MTKSIMLVGVGGQGTILASKLLTIGLMEAGYDVKMSEIHGMSQRGGSVSSQVRYSEENVYSPVIEIGAADMIVSFEKMEALRYLRYLKPEGKIVVNNFRLNSVSTLVGKFEYKEEEIDAELKRLNATVIDAAKKAEELDNTKVMNVILLGSLVKSMNLEHIDWEDIIRKNVKEKFVELNIKAFKEGIKLVQRDELAVAIE